MPELVYEEIPALSREEIGSAIRRNDPRELSYVVLALALHEPDLRFAESICIQFAKHEHFNVRGNAVLGFSHIARIHGKLDKEKVMLRINTALLGDHEWVRGHVQDVRGDLMHFLGWKFKHQ